MQRSSLQKVLAGAAAVAIFSLPGTTALADRGADLQSQADSASNKLQQTRDQLGSSQQQQDDLLGEISSADRSIVDLNAQLNSLNAELAAKSAEQAQVGAELQALRAAIAKTKAELQAAKKKLAHDKHVLNLRLRSIYTDGGNKSTYLLVLLNSRSFQDFISRFTFLNYVADRDAHLVQQVKVAKAQVEAKQVQQEQQRGQMEQKQVQLAADVQRITQLKSSQESQVASLQANKSQKQTLIGRLQKDQGALSLLEQREAAQATMAVSQLNDYNAQVAAVKAQQEAAAQAAAAAAAAQASPAAPAQESAPSYDSASTQGADGWVWPTGSPADITCGFGPRIAPTDGASTNHPGVDIGENEGTPIVAAHSGTVSFAGYAGGYGNLTEIDNGDGITTRYGHQSSIAVSQGQSVQAGQVIGYVGSTGVSTGPHLHFEIRVDGEPQNPMNWF